jgi:hypothetical protein
MPLLDHFHPPLNKRRHWQAFFHLWATYITAALNETLPEGYFAELKVHFDINEAEIEPALSAPVEDATEPDWKNSWTPPQPTDSFLFYRSTDVISVLVVEDGFEERLVGVVELVGASHKSSPAGRSAFTSRCEHYLQQQVGLIVADVVTEQSANLHAMLLERVIGDGAFVYDPTLYAAAYRPVTREHEMLLEIWFEPLALSAALPTLPLWLSRDGCVAVDLNAPYERACQKLRLDARLKQRAK